ncbi:MAG: T9SS type A sorting domain-containing protein [Bacteroidia bacterium]|nr:T9SS type A sorting domain-containing protein [Bacteroidia bacterium]
MKKIVTLLALIVCLANLKAQTYVTIPDANFVTWLQTNIPSAMNGNQMDITSPAITSQTMIVVSNQNISDLTGIEYFTSLLYLNCENNSLTGLPILPNSLSTLRCAYNQLVTLPTLPTSLTRLYCQNNSLTSLPSLPNSLQWLRCYFNQLTSLPVLPVGLRGLDCHNNNISCFPVFPEKLISSPAIQPFDISSNPFTCLPNYILAMDNATLNYPLCISGNTLTNPNGCGTGKGITGIVFHDLNSDCVNNTGDLLIKNGMVKLYNNSNVFLGMTNTYSSYFFNDTSGVYRVVLDTVNKPYAVQCINPGIDSLVTLTPTYVLEDSVDFAVICKPGFDVGVQSINRTGFVFPGLTHTLTVVAGDMSLWNNLVCNAGIGGTVSFSVNGPVSYVVPLAGALTPNVTGNVYTYTIANFGTIDNFTDFRLALTTHTNAQVGDFICVNATVTPVNGDNVPSNNVLEFCYPVVNSYDPNIKEVYPVTVQSNYNDWLTYTIHFQNTGNAPAVNIRLEDDLDSKLNPETFQVMNYSHYNILDVKGNHLTVRFPNIQLVDSTTDRHGSIGFIQYRIKPNTGWVNDTIKNKASIYFDYNAPIITNTAKSYILMPTAVKELYKVNGFDVYPNPSSSAIHIKIADGSITSKTYSIKIMDVLGKEILTTNYKEEINISNLEKGIYFLSVYQNKALIGTKKVVKE